MDASSLLGAEQLFDSDGAAFTCFWLGECHSSLVSYPTAGVIEGAAIVAGCKGGRTPRHRHRRSSHSCSPNGAVAQSPRLPALAGYLGWQAEKTPTPTGLRPDDYDKPQQTVATALRLTIPCNLFPKVGAGAPTLGWRPESLWDSSRAWARQLDAPHRHFLPHLPGNLCRGSRGRAFLCRR
jgi:hypothetical protein